MTLAIWKYEKGEKKNTHKKTSTTTTSTLHSGWTHWPTAVFLHNFSRKCFDIKKTKISHVEPKCARQQENSGFVVRFSVFSINICANKSFSLFGECFRWLSCIDLCVSVRLRLFRLMLLASKSTKIKYNILFNKVSNFILIRFFT